MVFLQQPQSDRAMNKMILASLNLYLSVLSLSCLIISLALFSVKYESLPYTKFKFLCFEHIHIPQLLFFSLKILALRNVNCNLVSFSYSF